MDDVMGVEVAIISLEEAFMVVDVASLELVVSVEVGELEALSKIR